MFDAIIDFGRSHPTLVPAVVNLVPLFTTHFSRSFFASPKMKWAFYLMLLTYSGFIGQFFYDFFSATKIQYVDLIGATLAYAGFLFVLISELMIQGLGRLLTKWRGDKWVKEIDYLYLSLGAAGLALSTNRLEVVDQKLSLPDYVGPFVIATALVVRAIKTRAEINGWNK